MICRWCKWTADQCARARWYLSPCRPTSSDNLGIYQSGPTADWHVLTHADACHHVHWTAVLVTCMSFHMYACSVARAAEPQCKDSWPIKETTVEQASMPGPASSQSNYYLSVFWKPSHVHKERLEKIWYRSSVHALASQCIYTSLHYGSFSWPAAR